MKKKARIKKFTDYRLETHIVMNIISQI